MSETTKRPISEAKKKANAKYNASAYDRIELKVSKGKKDNIKAHAEQYQESVGTIGTAGYSPKGSINAFINRAIDETMERDISAPAAPSENTHPVAERPIKE